MNDRTRRSAGSIRTASTRRWPRRCGRPVTLCARRPWTRVSMGSAATCSRRRTFCSGGASGARRGAGRNRGPYPRSGARRHGAHRPALGAFLQDLQAPDGHELRSEVAGRGRARAALGGRAGSPDRGRPTGKDRAGAGGDVRRAFRHPRRPTSWCSSAGSRAARCSAAAAAFAAAPVGSSISARATRPIRPTTTRRSSG